MFVESGFPLIVETATLVKAQQFDGRRFIYFETAREGVIDREGEDIAADALWNSRKLLLEQGNIDLNHWAWLGNPYGTGARPEYVIGLPLDVKRNGKSIFVKAEIFSNTTPPPPNSSGDWADKTWHGLTQQNPPLRLFPSVYGNVKEARVEERNGQKVRFLTKVEWYSVGLAQRAQHPALGAVSLEPMGGFAKAHGLNLNPERGQPLVLSMAQFAKAVSSGVATLSAHTGADMAARTDLGVYQGVSEERTGYNHCAPKVLNAILKGKLKPKREVIQAAFEQLGARDAQGYTTRLLKEARELTAKQN